MHGLLPSTLISHRTSVASVLRHWVYDPAADPYIKLLVRSFRLERPVQRRIRPKWDLHLVLSLLRPLFISQVEVHGKSSDDVIPLKSQRMFIHWKCSFRDIMRSHVSRWIVETVKEAYTLKLIVSTTVWQRMRSERFQLHGRTTVRWLYLTSCQRRFGGLQGCSRIRICATWLVLLRACRHWVQWWLYNM